MNAARKSTHEAAPDSYEKAIAELERIVNELDSNKIDVDALSEKVQRASFLIEWCNERITAAELAIESIAIDFEMDDEFDDDEDDE